MIFNGLEMISNLELINCIENIKECISKSKASFDFAKVEESLKTYSPKEIQAINERVLNCLKKEKDELSKCFNSILSDIVVG